MHILKFAGKRPKIPTGMKGTEVMARFDDAVALKSPWLSHMEEAYRFSIPHRNTFFDKTKGHKKNTDVFDATATLGVPSFATKMQSVLVPPWRNWSLLMLGPDIPKQQRESSQLKILLAENTELMFSHIHHSNMALQVHESFQDLAIGTGAFDLMAGPLGQKSLVFNAIPLTELVLEEGPQGTIETSYRELSISGRLLGRQWPGAQLPAQLALKTKDKPGEKSDFIEAVIFNPDTLSWEGAVIWKEEKELIWSASWNTNPRIVFRWSVTPGEVYGRGPIMQVLPDIKTANKVVEFILRNAAILVAGMWTAQSDSAINPYNFRLTPGAVIPVRSNDRSNPTIKALERTGDLRLGFEVLSQLQDNINRALFQHLREPSDAVVSATQFAAEFGELVDQAGSSFGRLQTETVESSISRTVDILSRRGAMPNIRIDGRQVTLKHTSPLARAQDLQDLLTLTRTLELPLPPEVVAAGIKLEEVAAWAAEKNGLDPRLIRDATERAMVQQQAAAAIAENPELARAA
jgi:hypothetical protein